MSEHLSFHSLWAREEQRPRLPTPGTPIPSTRSWEPPECPQRRRTEPPEVRRALCTEPPAAPPCPAAHSRKASFQTEGAVNPGAFLLGVGGGKGETAFQIGRIRRKRLQLETCLGDPCVPRWPVRRFQMRVRRGPLQCQGQGSHTCFSQGAFSSQETCVKTDM